MFAIARRVKVFDRRGSVAGHVPRIVAHAASSLATRNAQAATASDAIFKLGLPGSPVRRVHVARNLILIGVTVKDPDATQLTAIGIHSSHADAQVATVAALPCLPGTQ